MRWIKYYLFSFALTLATAHWNVAHAWIDVGAPLAKDPHVISAETRDRLRLDAEERAAVEASFLAELYQNPEKLFRDFPELRWVVEKNLFYRPHYWNHRLRASAAPSFHMSGTDYYPVGPDAFVAIEQNTTNVGGVLELWRMGAMGSEGLIRQWLEALRKEDRSVNPLTLYFVEETHYGLEWHEFRRDFKKTFGVALVSGEEISEGRFKVEDQKLFYRDEGGLVRQVTSMVMHFEPDFVDADSRVDRVLDYKLIVEGEKIAELQKMKIPGLERAILSGNLVTINEPGQDVACIKSLLAFMPELRKRYLGSKAYEIFPSAETLLFVRADGAVNALLLKQVLFDPTTYVIKDVQMTGGGDGVLFLAGRSPTEIDEVIQRIRREPWRFLAQKVLSPHLTKQGYRVEVRSPTLVAYNFRNARAEIIASSPSLFGRGAFGNKANLGSNIDPSKIVSVSSASQGISSFVVQVEINEACSEDLRRSLEAL